MYLLHSVVLDNLLDIDKHLVEYMFHCSYTVDSTKPFYNIVPCNLQDTDKFYLHCTNHCSHIFYRILSLDLKKNSFKHYFSIGWWDISSSQLFTKALCLLKKKIDKFGKFIFINLIINIKLYFLFISIIGILLEYWVNYFMCYKYKNMLLFFFK